VKHGFFSNELVLSDKEKIEFQALRRSLQSQLQPMTALASEGVHNDVLSVMASLENTCNYSHASL
jgi:molecular chaperone GrpE (heat shock protein)